MRCNEWERYILVLERGENVGVSSVISGFVQKLQSTKKRKRVGGVRGECCDEVVRGVISLKNWDWRAHGNAWEVEA